MLHDNDEQNNCINNNGEQTMVSRTRIHYFFPSDSDSKQVCSLFPLQMKISILRKTYLLLWAISDMLVIESFSHLWLSLFKKSSNVSVFFLSMILWSECDSLKINKGRHSTLIVCHRFLKTLTLLELTIFNHLHTKFSCWLNSKILLVRIWCSCP